MAHLQYLDELIREYLLFRGFTSTLKSFDTELKVDKDKGFRVDRIIDQFLQFIATYDLTSLRDLWSHMDQKMFSKLEHEYTQGIRKLESSLYKLYLVNAVSCNKTEKVSEFFVKMTPELQGQSEWKDWFMLPFVKNPEENPTFAVHFTKQWQDTLIVSLHNLLSIIYQVMPQPNLSSYEEEATKLRKLQEENEALKHKLATLSQCSNSIPDAVPPMDIMDDFYIIAQENPSGGDSHGKSLKNLIRTIGGGMPTSPIMGRKPHLQDEMYGPHKHSSKHRPHALQSWIKNPGTESVPKRSLSLDSRSRRTVGRDVSLDNVDRRSSSKKDNFLLLSQEKMTEHKAAVTQCRFNALGSLVASCDIDGVVKVWSTAPTPKVLSTMQYNEGLISLGWVAKNERFFVTGSKNGFLRLHDTKENKTVWDIGSEESPHLGDMQIVSVCCSPTENSVACSAVNTNYNVGKLLIFDIKSRKLERYLTFTMEPGLIANCCLYNHNGTLLMAGCSDGQIRALDLRHSECLNNWEIHDGSPITAMQITSDHNTCFTMGTDHKLTRHSLMQTSGECWSATLPKCHSTHGTQGFSLHQTDKHVLTACGHTGANIFQVTNGGLQLMLHLGGHRSPLTACDWTTANQCTTCLSASSDGKIKISTILTP